MSSLLKINKYLFGYSAKIKFIGKRDGAGNSGISIFAKKTEKFSLTIFPLNIQVNLSKFITSDEIPPIQHTRSSFKRIPLSTEEIDAINSGGQITPNFRKIQRIKNVKEEEW
jgi:hypothetical protein